MSGRRDLGTRMERVLQKAAYAAGCPLTILTAKWVRWSSASFDGARHLLTIELDETAASAAWLDALPEADLPIPGHLVADLVIASRSTSGGRITAAVEVLTVEAC
ncbi:hypothetical protein ACNFJ7_07500 [Sphingomonas sp. HT-1]|uniref:hypothetical protein n=1 Tax=unclassified Sphingomonas TaxID=196159 RepID=UPI0002D34EA2|nr:MULTISPECIES: hypothetical protein [unclassified Sphingomonas]